MTETSEQSGEERTGEVADQLLAHLRAELGQPALAFASPVRPLRGGYWAEIFAFRLAGAPPPLDRDLVLRLMPEAGAARRETAVQRAVAASGFAAPTVRMAGGADDGFGLPFMIMDLVPGQPMLAGLTARKLLRAAPHLVQQMEEQLAGTAVRLHLLDPEPIVEAVTRDVPDDPLGIEPLHRIIAERADVHHDPFLIEAVDRLGATRPEPTRLCICHGDLHPLNVLVDENGTTTLIDWSSSRLADPAYELAFTRLIIGGAPLDVPNALQRPLRALARWVADRIVRAYRQRAADHGLVLDDDQLDWHTGLHCARMLSELAVWEATGTRNQHAGHPFFAMRPGLEAELARVTGTSVPR